MGTQTHARLSSPALADSSALDPFDESEQHLQVIIETPKGSRNKYTYDHERHIFTLGKTLPSGMVFPFDFGFLPSTLAPDGDPIDVLVLMEESAFCGCLVPARLIGVIEGEQTEEGETTRNDRLLAVSESNHLYGSVTEMDELPRALLDEVGEFFVNYHRLQGREYRLLGNKGTAEARALIQQARAADQRK